MKGETRSTPSSGRSGQAHPIRWGALIRGIVALFLMVQVARLTLNLAQWRAPVKHASIATLLLALGLGVYGLWRLWQWIRTLTIRRLLIILLSLYLLTAFTVGLIRLDQGEIIQSWIEAAGWVPRMVARAIGYGGLAVIRFPGQFRTAYTGHTRLLHVPGTNDLPEEPVMANDPSVTERVIALPMAKSSLKRPSLGDKAVMTGPAGSVCQMHVLADGTFATEAIVELVEGPRFVKQEAWWRVRGEVGSGWCPGKVLAGLE